MYTVDKTAPIRAPQNLRPNVNNSDDDSSIEEERLAAERSRINARNERIYDEQIARRKLVDPNSNSTRKRTARPYSSVAASGSSTTSSTSSTSAPPSKRIALHKGTNTMGYSVSPFSQPEPQSSSSSSTQATAGTLLSLADLTDYEIVDELCDAYLSQPESSNSRRRRGGSSSGDSEDDSSDGDIPDLPAEAPPPSVFRQTTMLDTTDDAAVMAFMEKKMAEHGPMQKDLTWAIERQKQTYESGRDVWVPITDPFRRDLDSLRQEGEPEDPFPCFGCDYEELEGHNVAYVENWGILLQAFVKGLANCTKISSLARELHDVFTKTVVRRMNDDGIENASPSIWSVYCLIIHFLFHNPSPDIDLWVTNLRLRLMKNSICETEVFQMHITSGREKSKLKALTKLEKVSKLQLLWLKSNPANMAYACRNRRVDATSVSYLNPRVPVSEQTSFSQPQSRFG